MDHIQKINDFCEKALDMDAAFFPFYRCNDDDKTPKTRADANEDFYFSPGTMNAMNRAAGGAVAAVVIRCVVIHTFDFFKNFLKY